MNEFLSVSELPLSHLDNSSSTPLYRQIEDDLRQLIRDGFLQPGVVLPPEVELSRAYGVGRQTVRTALARLASGDLIARYAGRGTFVKAQPDRLHFYLDQSFTRQMAEMGLQAYSRVLEHASGIISDVSPQPLRNHIGAPFLQLVRLRLGDGEPFGIQATTLLTKRCPGIEQIDFSQQSLYAVLATRYRLPIVEINHTVSAATADELQAALLQIASGAPLLVVNTTALVENGEAIEHTTSYYRADKYEYSIKHTYSLSG